MLFVNGSAQISAAVAPLQREPSVSATQTSQLLAGHTVQLLEQRGDWWRLAGSDRYEGFMHAGYLEAVRSDVHEARLSLGATVRISNGDVRTFPFGARVTGKAEVLGGEIIAASDVATVFLRSPSAIGETATQYFSGASYQWGGVTPWGCDCSGLVQSVFAVHGIPLPRDAWQQAGAGSALSVTELNQGTAGAFEPADLLFFSDRQDRRITHVGIALGSGRLVHSALGRGGVRVEELNEDSDYMRRLRANFVGASRAEMPGVKG